MTLNITGTQHKNTLYRVQSECHYAECRSAECHSAKCHSAECRYAECRYAECHYAECHYAECRYAECRYAECRGALSLTASVITTVKSFKVQAPGSLRNILRKSFLRVFAIIKQTVAQEHCKNPFYHFTFNRRLVDTIRSGANIIKYFTP